MFLAVDKVLNQLVLVNRLYYWVSLNECGMDWNVDGLPERTIQAAIEDAMELGHDVYQLDTLEELTEFILEDL